MEAQPGRHDLRQRPCHGGSGLRRQSLFAVTPGQLSRYARRFQNYEQLGREWGQNGYIWVRYRYYAEFCKQAFAIVMQGGEPIEHNERLIAAQETREEQPRREKPSRVSRPARRSGDKLMGAFGFRQFSHWDGETPVFEEVPVAFKRDQYELRGGYKVGDRFQLYVENGFNQGFIYVFSVDAQGKSEVHFPRSGQYSQKFAGQEQSALIWESGSELIIPTVNSTLDLEQRGKDHLIALYWHLQPEPTIPAAINGPLIRGSR